MEIRVVCGQCGAEYRVADEKLAKKKLGFSCKKCGQAIQIEPATDGFSVSGGDLKSPFATQGLPSQFGKFTELERIASGGMGDIFRAKLGGAEGFERTVALKVLHPHLARDESFARAMVDEAKITVLMHHPNIVQMYNLERTGDVLYCVMEYVPGKSLARIQRTYRKKGARVPLEMALYIVMQMLDGLAYAHELKGPDGKPLGIVHRDISPQNILVTGDGWVKIIDFGIAKAARRITQTMPGIIKGKFAYMAPEQLKGQTDHRADIFATGVVLWETLAGVRLFHSTTDVDTLHRVLHLQPPPLNLNRQEIPPELDKIIDRALAKDPEQRFQSAREFKRALAGFMAPASMEDLREKVDIDAAGVEAGEADGKLESGAEFSERTPVVESASLQSLTPGTTRRLRPGLWLAALVVLVVLAAGLWWSLPRLLEGSVRDGGAGGGDAGMSDGGTEVATVAAGDAGTTGKADSADAGTTVAVVRRPDRKTSRPPRKLTRKMIERVIRRRAARLQSCANEHLRKIKPGGAVSLKLRFTIARSGRVSHANLEPPALEKSEFGSCLLKQVRALRFPRHKDASVSIGFPLTFQATQQQGKE